MGAEGPVTALVVAAGLGKRLPGDLPKGLRLLGGQPLFLHSLLAFERAPSVDRHVLVVPVDQLGSARAAAEKRLRKPLTVVAGGGRRQDSVLRGLLAAERAGDSPSHELRATALVAVHDAARPFVDPALIERTVVAARAAGAALPLIPVCDTVREIDTAGGPPRLIDRERLRLAQTPQTARLRWLIEAYRRAESAGVSVTDEGAVLSFAGRSFTVVEGSPLNFKITTPEELASAERILASREATIETRIGYGEDRHPRDRSRPFILAGIVLDVKDGPRGHSDGDPLCHALVDALLGATGSGNIGDLFPDTDPRWAGASGLDLLERTALHVSNDGWRTINVDAVVIADSPRLSPHVPEIRRRIAAALGTEESCVSVKGKRAEGLGFEAAGSGVACRAVALLARGGRP